jgi:hypothetical protein
VVKSGCFKHKPSKPLTGLAAAVARDLFESNRRTVGVCALSENWRQQPKDEELDAAPISAAFQTWCNCCVCTCAKNAIRQLDAELEKGIQLCYQYLQLYFELLHRSTNAARV